MPKREPPPPSWRNRIVGSGEADPKTLLPNEKNWRGHPKAQAAALDAALDEVGWVQQVIVNRTTGKLVDGHLRVERAIARGERSVPFLEIELTPEEELLILATLDPIGAMATANKEVLAGLISEVATGQAALQQLIADVAEKAGAILDSHPAPGDDPAPDPPGSYESQYGVIVLCEDDGEQERVYDELMAQGYHCRVVVT